ncbi:Interactor of constitutive active ROPs 3 [Platanthera zijinensis]|uniref:Interactor of constitutive active ROPs 3 n=1 Tax=Platanthera zijinensis TaxID=2320716 RepID=A0AAP0BSQ2_9ASPA
MPRSRGSEMSQARLSPRAPLHLKSTACSEANSVHRHSSERSSSMEDRRSPLNERKKASSRVADLETKLEQAQEELRKLKEELTAAEEARRDAQTELEVTKKLFPGSPPPTAAQDLEDVKEKTMNIDEDQKLDDEQVPVLEAAVALPGEEDGGVNFPTTDVFEVAPVSGEGEGSNRKEEDADEGTETKAVIEEGSIREEVGIGESEKEEEEIVESPEMAELRSFLAEKENQLESILVENRFLKKEAEDARGRSSAATEKAEEALTKLAGAEEELRLSKMTAERLREKLDSVETAKASLEAEMKRLRVQTDQWRKAAEAAAAVLAADGAALNDSNLNGRKLGESCRSMEKHLQGYDSTAGGGRWSPVIAGGEGDDGNRGAKRRGAGGRIQVLGELWRKKGQMK